MSTLKGFGWLLVAAGALLVGAISIDGRHRQPFDTLNGFLFGQEWRFNRVCSNEYSDEQLIANDHQISSLYDGSFLQAIEESSEWSEALNKLDIANQIGLQSRKKLGVTCSAEAWGFADRAEERLSNEPSRDDFECRAQIDQLHSFVKALTGEAEACEAGAECRSRATDGTIFSLKLWEQLNSFGRISTGLPFQQNLLLGDFDSCARLNSTRYCIGAYGRKDAAHEFSNERNSHLVGMCLPRPCSSEFLSSSPALMGKLDSLVSVNMPNIMQIFTHKSKAHDGSQLNGIFCPPARDSAYRKLFKDKMSIALSVAAVLWLGALVYATFLGDIFQVPASRDTTPSGKRGLDTLQGAVLRWFNVRANLSEFLNSSHGDEQLIGLNAIKVLGMIWLMTTHLSMLIYPYIKNPNQLKSYYMTNAHGPLIIQGQHCVSLFFTIGGLLFGMKHLVLPEINIKQVIVWRYLRLMPMYLVAYAYVREFSHLLGDGPLWDSGVSRQSEVRQCRLESWWVPLLMLSNFKSSFSHCILTGWHISNDFQIYLVLPLLLLARRHLKRTGFILLISGAFIITHLSHMWLLGGAENYDLQLLMKDPARFGPHYILTRLGLDYVNPLGRLGTYLMGVLVADLLLERRQQQRQQHQEQQQRKLQQEKHRQQLSKQGRKRVAIEEETSAVGSYNGQPAERRSSVGKRKGHATGQEKNNPATSVSFLIDSSTPLGQPDQQAASSMNEDNTANSDECREQAKMKVAGRRSSPTPSLASSSSSSSRSACGTPDQNRPPLTNFKDKCLLSLGVAFLAVSLYAVFILPEGSLTDEMGSHSKHISYPLCRLLVELGWSILLYYFLLTNLADGQLEASRSRQSPARGTETGTEERKGLLVMDRLKKQAASNDLALASEWTLSGCRNSHRPMFVAALKWRVWNVLVKANYAVMLTHYALFRLVVQSQRELFLFTWFNFFQLLTILVGLSYLLGALIYVAVERPLTGLVRHLAAPFLLP